RRRHGPGRLPRFELRAALAGAAQSARSRLGSLGFCFTLITVTTMTHTPTRPSFVLGTLRRALLAAAAASTFSVSGAALAEVDFSGLYFPSGPRPAAPNPPPFTPGAQAAADAYRAAFTIDDDPGRYCIWPGMPRAIWGAPFTIEIQQRPQDITFFWEGYGMYRKIYMADHNPPKPLLAS